MRHGPFRIACRRASRRAQRRSSRRPSPRPSRALTSAASSPPRVSGSAGSRAGGAARQGRCWCLPCHTQQRRAPPRTHTGQLVADLRAGPNKAVPASAAAAAAPKVRQACACTCVPLLRAHTCANTGSLNRHGQSCSNAACACHAWPPKHAHCMRSRATASSAVPALSRRQPEPGAGPGPASAAAPARKAAAEPPPAKKSKYFSEGDEEADGAKPGKRCARGMGESYVWPMVAAVRSIVLSMLCWLVSEHAARRHHPSSSPAHLRIRSTIPCRIAGLAEHARNPPTPLSIAALLPPRRPPHQHQLPPKQRRRPSTLRPLPAPAAAAASPPGRQRPRAPQPRNARPS